MLWEPRYPLPRRVLHKYEGVNPDQLGNALYKSRNGSAVLNDNIRKSRSKRGNVDLVTMVDNTVSWTVPAQEGGCLVIKKTS